MFCSSTSTTEQYIFSLEYLHFCGGVLTARGHPSRVLHGKHARRCNRDGRLKAHPCHGRLHNSTQHFPVRREKKRAASESTYASVHRQADTKKQRTAFLHTITHAVQHKSRHSQPYRPVLNMRCRSMNSEETITQCKSTTPLIH